MSILNYLKPQNGLPDPNGPFSLRLPSQAIALANREVAKATKESNMKRSQYKRYVSIIEIQTYPDKSCQYNIVAGREMTNTLSFLL